MDRLERSEHELRERIKELNCLYGISKIAEIPEITVGELLQETVDLIPPAFQYPEITTARIMYDGSTYKTVMFKETPWKVLRQVTIAGKMLTFEVFYLEDKQFLEFEELLVTDIVNRLQVIIHNKEEMKKQLLDARLRALSELNKQLEARVLDRADISDIDEIDRQIISLLRQDGRMKLVDLGNNLIVKGKEGYSHVGVKNRLMKLIDNDTIRIQSNVNLMKFRAVIGILLLETETNDAAARIIKKYADCPRILFAFRTCGSFDLVFGIVAENIENLEKIMNSRSPRCEPGIRATMSLVSPTMLSPRFIPTRYFSASTSETFPCGLNAISEKGETLGEACPRCPSMLNYFKKEESR